MKHTLSVVVEDESGALSRIAGLFARRGFNIDSLAVGPAETQGQSRLTMVVEGDDQTLQQMTKQLDKLVNVLQVLDLTRLPAVERELMLLKVSATAPQRSVILDLVQVFRAKVVDVADVLPSTIFNSAAVEAILVPPISSVVTDISPATVTNPSATVIRSVSSV